jgi:hypothetical protein
LLETEGKASPGSGWCSAISRWAQIQLPNGQVAQSAWKETLKLLENTQMARNVKVHLPISLIWFNLIHLLTSTLAWVDWKTTFCRSLILFPPQHW